MEKEMVTRTIACAACKKEKAITAPRREYERWEQGDLLQVALTSLTAGEREMLLSGICPTCWEDFFSEELSEHEMEDNGYHEDEEEL